MVLMARHLGLLGNLAKIVNLAVLNNLAKIYAKGKGFLENCAELREPDVRNGVTICRTMI